jgi:hypothetical protein
MMPLDSKYYTYAMSGLFVVALVCGLQFVKLFYLTPLPEYTWDNVYLWDWARSVSNGDYLNFVADSHHQLRWGNWSFATLLISAFSDEVLFYYLATFIPSSLAYLLFSMFAWRYIGLTGAILFALLWFLDALLFRASFQLLPSGSGLLPLAILFGLALSALEANKVELSRAIGIGVVIFWLYGTKETHLAYIPGLLLLIYQVGGVKPVATILSVIFCGYIVETIAFGQLSNEFSSFGRIASLVDGGQHVKLMTESGLFVNPQNQYYDGGITMRWLLVSGVTSIPVFIGFIFSLFVISDDRQLVNGRDKDSDLRLKKLLRVCAYFIVSFLIFTSFFVISVDPIRLGQPLVPRYVTTLLPFLYLVIIAYLVQQSLDKSIGYKLALLAIMPFFAASSIERISNYKTYSAVGLSESYNKFSQDLIRYECISATQQSIVMNQLDLIPLKYRDFRLNLMINNEAVFDPKLGRYVVKTLNDKECQSMYKIHRGEPMSY